MTPLLHVEGLNIWLDGGPNAVPLVDGVSFDVERGQVFGLAGESGSGKTLTSLAFLGLLPKGAHVAGRAVLDDRNLLAMRPRELRAARGSEIAMVFQDPMTSLHPMLSVERQMTEHLRHHLGTGRRQARRRAIELLAEVRIPDAEGALRGFPHQFSGGMRQRIQIAMALACQPKLLVADEPTTALDVTVQAGILRLLDHLCRANGLGVILITHDLGVLSAIADTVSVMYAGRVVESGPSELVLQRPRHPYTRGLLDALPHPDHPDRSLQPIRGAPPNLADRPPGCAFHPRCAYAVDSCHRDVPALLQREAGQAAACPVDPLASALGEMR
ncbi:MAG: ABC transporter ATP-binding protein [Candidatus Dormiibacterota bacterium]